MQPNGVVNSTFQSNPWYDITNSGATASKQGDGFWKTVVFSVLLASGSHSADVNIDTCTANGGCDIALGVVYEDVVVNEGSGHWSPGYQPELPSQTRGVEYLGNRCGTR